MSSVATCFSYPNVHSIFFTSFQPIRSQHNPSRLFFGLNLYALPPFCTITFAGHSIPHLPPYVSIPDTNWQVQLAKIFLSLFGRNFCEQQLVLEKGSSQTQWNGPSLACVLTILGWLWCFTIFKIDYLITSNVRIGMVIINPVTYIIMSRLKMQV